MTAGVSVDGIPTTNYSEGLQTGYRGYQAQGIEPLFPFGFGLSYTTFAISKLEVTPKVSDGKHAILVQFFVQNTGSTPGAEVPQVYMGLPPATGEPPTRLVAFNKVKLNPGEKTKVQVLIDPAATNHPLATWDTESQNWTVAQGDYQVYVGNSSADVAAADSLTVRTPAGQGH